MSEEELELFENIYDLGIGECPTDDIEQAGLIFDKAKNIIEENKELKEQIKLFKKDLAKAESICQKYKSQYYDIKLILTEFEKWLEKQLTYTFTKDDKTIGYKKGLNESLDKLQELKETYNNGLIQKEKY